MRADASGSDVDGPFVDNGDLPGGTNIPDQEVKSERLFEPGSSANNRAGACLTV